MEKVRGGIRAFDTEHEGWDVVCDLMEVEYREMRRGWVRAFFFLYRRRFGVVVI